MMGTVNLTFHSELAAAPDHLWAWITSIDGISSELRPLLRMTAPAGVTSISDLNVEPGKPLFRSWVLLFGVIPVDRSDLTLLRLEPGQGFFEQSPMLSMKLWQHERSLQPLEGGTRLTDHLTFQPRFATFITRWFIQTVFNHRHRVLRRHFGQLNV